MQISLCHFVSDCVHISKTLFTRGKREGLYDANYGLIIILIFMYLNVCSVNENIK